MKNLRKENTTHKCPRVVNANELVYLTRKLLHEPKSLGQGTSEKQRNKKRGSKTFEKE